MEYDGRNSLASILYPSGHGFAFEYNDAGRRTARIGDDGFVLYHGYDEAGRLQAVSDMPIGSGAPFVEYAYNSAGSLAAEYRRNGTANLFMLFEPLAGRRRVKVTRRRTKVDWADLIKELVEVDYPEADSIVLVMDNLNTHSKASLYEAFEPREAKRIADKLEIHHTPKHGSWLNVAESELSILSRQCLERRIGDIETLRREVAAWQRGRDAQARPVDWQFTVEDARIRLKGLYPTLQS